MAADDDDSESVTDGGESVPATDGTDGESATGSTESGQTSDGTCPQCGETLIQGSDKCYSCGASVDSGEGVSIELWEWGGGLIAGIGIFMTPLVTGLPALYCAYRVYEHKPMSAYAILALLATTVVAWTLVFLTYL